LPEELRIKFEARRGRKRTDIPLDQFLKDIGYVAKAKDKTKIANENVRATANRQKAKSASKKPKMVQVAAQKAYAMKSR
jgi:hypothetical protein